MPWPCCPVCILSLPSVWTRRAVRGRITQGAACSLSSSSLALRRSRLCVVCRAQYLFAFRFVRARSVRDTSTGASRHRLTTRAPDSGILSLTLSLTHQAAPGSATSSAVIRADEIRPALSWPMRSSSSEVRLNFLICSSASPSPAAASARRARSCGVRPAAPSMACGWSDRCACRRQVGVDGGGGDRRGRKSEAP